MLIQLAGIDPLTGKVTSLARDRHRSRAFFEFLQLLDAAYRTDTAIKLFLDNHSAHISPETTAWLTMPRAGRFEFAFTPKHDFWLNHIEGFFSSRSARGPASHPGDITTRTLGTHHGRIAPEYGM